MRIASIGAVVVMVLVSLSSSVQTQTAKAASPTFTKDVAPILYSKCVTCHRAGEIGPMALVTYKDVRPWAASIKDKVSNRVMPPWHADPHVGAFRNDRSLSDREIDTIVQWVNGGAPEGNPSQLPAAPQFADGWQIGKPDAVFEMATEFEIPARGTVDYQYFEVPTNFTEDRWMQAGEARAGDRAHVHHIIVSVIEPGAVRRPNVMNVKAIAAEGQTAAAAPARAPRQLTDEQRAGLVRASRFAGANMLVNWAVGEDAPVHPAGLAKRIPAGSTLLFQVHYTTNGTPGKDRSKIGFIFLKEPPKQELRTGAIANAQFRDSARRVQSPRRSGSQLHQRREDLDDASAHAFPRQGHDLYGDLSRRPQRGRAARAEVRLQLAGRLLVEAAAVTAKGIDAARDRAFR
jgi:hypothetical protein